MAKPTSRRAVLGWIGLTALPGTAVLAQDYEVPDPTDLVPRRYTPEAFLQLTDSELYMVKLAVRRGRRIMIDGCSASESRDIIRATSGDRAAARQMLRDKCSG